MKSLFSKSFESLCLILLTVGLIGCGNQSKLDKVLNLLQNLEDSKLSAEETVEMAQKAVKLSRQLPEGHEGLYLTSLVSLANGLAEAGRISEAIETATEAIEYSRQLSEVSMSPMLQLTLPMLQISAYGVLATCLGESGRAEEAIEAANEAVKISRQLPSHDISYGISKILALQFLGTQLSKAGRSVEAIKPAKEAVGVARKMVQEDAVWLEQSAVTLKTLVERLCKVGRHAEAIRPAKEMVEIYRELVQEDDDKLSSLADALETLAETCREAGRLTESFKSAEEAEDLNRKLGK